MSDGKQMNTRPAGQPAGQSAGSPSGQPPRDANPMSRPGAMMGRGPGAGHGLGMPGEKAKDFKSALKRLAGYLKPHTGSLLLVLILAILSTAFSVSGPKILGKAITVLFEGMVASSGSGVISGGAAGTGLHSAAAGAAAGGTSSAGAAAGVAGMAAAGGNAAAIDYAKVGTILLTLLALYLASSVFGYVTQLVMASVSQKTVYSLRKGIDAKLSRLPLAYFDGRTHGEVLSRVTNDVDTIANTLQQSLVQIITSVVTLIGSVIMMMSISWQLTLVALATLPLYVAATMFVTKRSQGYFRSQQKLIGQLNGHIEEMYSGHTVVKAFGYEGESLKRFGAINNELFSVAWKAQFISGIMMPVMNFINSVGYVLIAAIGGVMAARRAVSLGDIQAFIQYARQFTQPIIQTANIANVLQSTLAASERVFEVLDEKEELPDAPATSPAATRFQSACGAVVFDSITFGYTPGAPLMKGLSLEAPCGETVAIVGPTGAGKTTLVNLLMRFYELDGGAITVNGVDIRELPRGMLRRSFGMVLQDAWLFNGTIRDNIAYGKEGATQADIEAAAVAAHADHFIRVLPDGYDTVLNEEASNLSQGQRQLLTIARAFLADPRILILDEATSSVDTRTELVVRKAMEKLRQGRTSFVIAHRLSTIRDAHTILVMNEGSIVEKGTHEGLLAAGGFYAELYRSQFAGATV